MSAQAPHPLAAVSGEPRNTSLPSLPPSSPRQPGLAPRVLIVDDCLVICTLLRIAFEQEGFALEVAHDGAAALAALGKGPLDAIVCDLHMPGIDGLGLLQHVRTHAHHANVPVLMITADTRATARDAARAAGASVFVNKPFRAQQVVAIVRKVMGAARAAPR